MTWLWSSGGGASLFDPYSLYHIVFFIALTTILYPIFQRHVWGAILSIAFVWEVFEEWIVSNMPAFPYVGNEQFINKCIGDPISDLVGFGIAIMAIRFIRKIEYEKFKRTCVENRKEK